MYVYFLEGPIRISGIDCKSEGVPGRPESKILRILYG